MMRALLIRAREQSGLTVSALARLIAEQTGRSSEGVRTTIQRYEAEGGPEPGTATVLDVLNALDLDLALVPRSAKKPTNKPK